MTDQGYAGPRRIWHINKSAYGCHDYQFLSWSLFRWEFSDGCRGAQGRTPWGAWWCWNRWRRGGFDPVNAQIQ